MLIPKYVFALIVGIHPFGVFTNTMFSAHYNAICSYIEPALYLLNSSALEFI